MCFDCQPFSRLIAKAVRDIVFSALQGINRLINIHVKIVKAMG